MFTTSFIVFTTVLQCSFTSANFVVNEGGSVIVGVQLFGTPSANVQKTIQCVSGSAGTQRQIFVTDVTSMGGLKK